MPLWMISIIFLYVEFHPKIIEVLFCPQGIYSSDYCPFELTISGTNVRSGNILHSPCEESFQFTGYPQRSWNTGFESISLTFSGPMRKRSSLELKRTVSILKLSMQIWTFFHHDTRTIHFSGIQSR